MHARRIRPDTGPTDRRRLAAAGLSAILPGSRPGLQRPAPTGALVPHPVADPHRDRPDRLQDPVPDPAGRVGRRADGPRHAPHAQPRPARVAARRGRPGVPRHPPAGPDRALRARSGSSLLALLVIVPARRRLAVRDHRRRDVRTRLRRARSCSATGEPGPSRGPQPNDTDRINVLLVGVDSTKKRTEMLTDTMMVVSLDPVGHTVSMVSLPRDLVNVPLGQRRRLRTEAQLAALVRRAPPRRVPGRRHAHAPERRRAPCSASRSRTTPSSTSPGSSTWSMPSAGSTSR